MAAGKGKSGGMRHVLSLLGLERRARDARPDIERFLAALPDKAKSAS